MIVNVIIDQRLIGEIKINFGYQNPNFSSLCFLKSLHEARSTLRFHEIVKKQINSLVEGKQVFKRSEHYEELVEAYNFSYKNE